MKVKTTAELEKMRQAEIPGQSPPAPESPGLGALVEAVKESTAQNAAGIQSAVQAMTAAMAEREPVKIEAPKPRIVTKWDFKFNRSRNGFLENIVVTALKVE